jgi:sodium-dependent dicarboxylate transporter 2/3/5
MMAETKVKSDGYRKKLILIAITLIIMYIGPLVIPTWGPVTEMGVKMLCVYVGVLLMFIATGDIFSGSILGIIATVIHGYYELNDMWNFVFGSSTAVQMVAMLCFAYAVRETGAFDTLGRKIVRASRGFKRFPFIFCIAFMMCMYVCLWFISALAAVVTIIPLFEAIAKAAGYKVEDRWHKIMIAILFLFAGAGWYTMGTDGMELGWIGLFENAVNFEYTYKPLELMVSMRITLAVLVVVWMFMAKFLKADMKKLATIDFDHVEELKKENTRLNNRQRIVLIMFLIVIVRSLISNPFAEGTLAARVYDVFDMKTLAFLALVVGTYVRVDKKPIINAGKAMASLPWGVFLVLGTMMVIAGALSNEELGLRTWLVSVLDPLFGTQNYLLFCFLILFFTTFITNLMSNQATIMIMLSVAAPFLDKFVEAGYNVTPLVGGVCILGNFAIMLYCSGAISPYFVDRAEMKADKKFVFTIVPLLLLAAVVVTTLGAVVFGKIM